MSSPVKLSRHKGPSWTRSSLTSLTNSTGGSLHPDPPSKQQQLAPGVLRTTSLYDTTLTRSIEDRKMRDEVHHLEKIVEFLKSQHSETLNHLHNEIQKLKLENKELNFKLVMCRCGQSSSSSREETSQDELALATNKVKELSNSLHHERIRNSQLMKLIEHQIQKSYEHGDGHSQANGDSKITYNELPATIQGCRELINELKMTNQQQNHELIQLKADLQDLLYSDKVTPDAYLIARAYIPHTAESDISSKPKLPQIHVVRRNDHVKEKAYQRLHESVHLPALKPRPSLLFSERHRRTLSLQRNKLDELTKDCL